MNLRKSAILAAIAAAAFACYAAVDNVTGPIDSDVQLKAMADELARSKTLELANLDKPYFIQYSISDAQGSTIGASLGGITYSNDFHVRHPDVVVRVGAYGFDNMNSVFSGTPRFGLLPVDDDYGVIRTEFWRITDALYKGATDQITRKRNAQREIADPDKTPDFAPAKAIRVLEASPRDNFDRNKWEAVLRKASESFVPDKDIATSSVSVRSISSTYRLMNTEGTVMRIPQTMSELQIRATAIAPDGAHVWTQRSLAGLATSDLPSEADVTRFAQQTASEADFLAKAPAAEDYNGPVLFDDEAGAQLMAQVLTDAVVIRRKPVSPPGQGGGAQVLDSVWSSKLNAKVAPDWLTVIDDPKTAEFAGRRLAGTYAVDDEGVPAQRVDLVEKGTLKNFLLSRVPVRTFNASNGHGRLPGPFGMQQAVLGNVFVETSEPVSRAQLRARLLEKVKTAGLKYGFVIRRLDYPSTASLEELQGIVQQLQKGGFARTLNAPLLAYRVYPDGHEEMVRGLRFREFSAKELRDLSAASDTPVVFNFVNNGSSLNYADTGSDATTSTVVCPALLFDSVELAKSENEKGAAPVVPAPASVLK